MPQRRKPTQYIRTLRSQFMSSLLCCCLKYNLFATHLGDENLIENLGPPLEYTTWSYCLPIGGDFLLAYSSGFLTAGNPLMCLQVVSGFHLQTECFSR